MHTTTISGRLHGRGARIAVSAIIAAFLAVLAVPALTSTPASAHGWITNPPSRQDNCANGATSFSCGGISYEPQSVEAPKGSMQCSGGSGYDILDDESLPWPRTNVSNSVTLQWKLTAAHSTSTWEYFVDGQLWATYDQGGQQPPSNIQHTLTGLPSGDHTILARWNVADTPMAFYNCVDITVGGSTSTPTPTPTDTSTPTPTPTTPGECAAAWNTDTQYNGGDVVSYNGSEWSAKWWTQGETPGEQWGPWVEQGACGSSSPTPTPTGTSTSTPTPTATATSTPSPTPTSTTTPVCDAPAYVAGDVYIGGDQVTYQNQVWKARWWNQNQAPSAAEPWGPWEALTC